MRALADLRIRVTDNQGAFWRVTVVGTTRGNPTFKAPFDDDTSYEYGNADRASQYYGELHWTTAWPILQQKFGR